MSEVGLLKPGKYEFYISGIIENNKDGNPLLMKNGQPYKKLRVTVIDKDNYCFDVYDLIFDVDKIRQIFNAIGKYISSDTKLDLTHLNHHLIGQRGECLVGIRKGTNGYKDQNEIKCYIAKDIKGPSSPFIPVHTIESSHLDEAEDLPF